MKKWMAMMLAVLMLGMTACKNKEETKATEQDTTVLAENAAEIVTGDGEGVPVEIEMVAMKPVEVCIADVDGIMIMVRGIELLENDGLLRAWLSIDNKSETDLAYSLKIIGLNGMAWDDTLEGETPAAELKEVYFDFSIEELEKLEIYDIHEIKMAIRGTDAASDAELFRSDEVIVWAG